MAGASRRARVRPRRGLGEGGGGGGRGKTPAQGGSFRPRARPAPRAMRPSAGPSASSPRFPTRRRQLALRARRSRNGSSTKGSLRAARTTTAAAARAAGRAALPRAAAPRANRAPRCCCASCIVCSVRVGGRRETARGGQFATPSSPRRAESRGRRDPATPRAERAGGEGEVGCAAHPAADPPPARGRPHFASPGRVVFLFFRKAGAAASAPAFRPPSGPRRTRAARGRSARLPSTRRAGGR